MYMQKDEVLEEEGKLEDEMEEGEKKKVRLVS